MTTSPAARRLSSLVLALGMSVLLLAGPLAPKASAASALPLLDATFATLLNTLRSTLGVGSLTVDPQLSNVALGWSRNMAATGVMAHNPNVRAQVVGWAKVGENVGYGPAVTQIFDALVASPPHMRNMSDGEFTRIGVATVADATGRLWTTHVFMRPGGTIAAPAVATSPAPTTATAPAAPKALKPVPTTAAPATSPPTTAAPATVPAPTTVPTTAAPAPAPAPAPAVVVAAGRSGPTEATVPVTRTDSSPDGGGPPPLLVGAALLGLVVLVGAAFLLRRRSLQAAPLPAVFRAPPEDLTKVLDLL